MNRAVVWFTKDLRLHDNETLCRAIDSCDEVIPLYCLDEEVFNKTTFGFQKTGPFRKKFLYESLLDLNEQLKLLGSGLILLKGKPEVVIPEFTSKYYVGKVFTMSQFAPEEIKLQQKVESELHKVNCQIDTFSTQSLYDKKDLPFSVAQVPEVFTSFRNKVESKSSVRTTFNCPSNIKTPPIDATSQLELYLEINNYSFTADSRAAMQFKGGESEGIKRLHYYLEGSHAIETYKVTRNGLIGERYSTKFSPWLAMGCLSPRLVYHEIKKYEKQHLANESTYWVIFELLWREFFIWMMKKHPNQYFKLNGISNSQTLLPKNDEASLLKWINGETKSDFVNANMIELKLTGFMSNRGRQNVASYLCNDLNLDWRYGAAYFEQQLIDYDVSSNWCNWTYIAGVGNNPRGKSVFNIEKQANDYDSDKSYRKLWLENVQNHLKY